MKSIGTISTMFEQELLKIEALLKTIAFNDLDILPTIGDHIIKSGGKRLRPLLVLMCAKLCHIQNKTDLTDREIKIATCVELLHLATLLHDDVVDESTERRGKPSANVIWGNNLSVLTGDYLIARLFELLVEDGDMKVLSNFAQTTKTIVEGETLQQAARFLSAISLDQYLSVIVGKTAYLFESTAYLGTHIAHGNSETKQALTTFTKHLGIAFQITDDLQDYLALQEFLGKPNGSDFFEGLFTLPLILLKEKTKDQALLDIISSKKRIPQDLSTIQKALFEYSIHEDIKALAETHISTALDALKDLEDNECIGLFKDIAAYTLKRCEDQYILNLTKEAV